MTRASRWMVPVVAVATVLLASAGAVAGATRVGAHRAGQARAATAVSNHLISGTETSISCLTPARCVAVGAGSRGTQVVSLDNGRPTKVTVLRYRAPLTSVSCPNKTGCWAIGPLPGPRRGAIAGVLLVKIGPAGQVTKVIHIAAPAGDDLFQIGCRTMTACQILGENQNGQTNLLIFFSPWNGSRWRLDSQGGGGFYYGTSVAGFSCWRTTCVVIGWERFDSSQGQRFAWTFNDGVSGPINFTGPSSQNQIANFTFNAVSCVSASTCYVVGYNGYNHVGGMVLAISGGVPSATHEPVPFTANAIACIRVTCWAVGGNEIVTLRGGVAVARTAMTDTAVSTFAGIAADGNGYIAIGAAAEPGESDVVIGWPRKANCPRRGHQRWILGPGAEASPALAGVSALDRHQEL
jgi:hypothetical protein